MKGNPLMDEEYLQSLPKAVADNLQAQNQYIIGIICNRIKEIGSLIPSDAQRISAAYYAGADMERITAELERVTKLNHREIESIYEQVAADNTEFARTLYEFRSLAHIPFEQNEALQSMVYAMSLITKGEYDNLSRTAGFVSRDGRALTIREQYIKAIDRAITNVATGATDYQSEVRAVVKEMAQSGYRTISYGSGYSRRMDSAVRQNILTGIKDISQQMQKDIGQAVGADGYEISYHRCPRPSHAAMGGKQYTKEEFHRQGIDRLLQDYNCYHIAFEIIIGVSSPNFSKSELATLKAEDAKPRQYGGKEITGYEATQIQRRYETKLRRLKDEAYALKAAGDTTGYSLARSRIREVSGEYGRFSEAVGLSVKGNRTRVVEHK